MPPDLDRLRTRLEAVANSAADLRAAADLLPDTVSLKRPAVELAEAATETIRLLPPEDEFSSDWEEDPTLAASLERDRVLAGRARLKPSIKRMAKARPLPRVLPLC